MTLDDGISERALNYAFLKEFLELDQAEWIEFVSIQLGHKETQPKELLLEQINKLIKTATNSNKFGL
jgi:hypothetical protein